MNNADSDFCLRWAKRIRAIRLLGGKCIKCGTSEIFAIEFHHPNKDKNNDVFEGLMKSRWSIIEKEIKKCQLLCRNCHCETHGFGKGSRNEKLKQKLLDVKKQYCCEECGYVPNKLCSLSFHHMKEKKFLINSVSMRFANISWEDIVLEIEKCKVLCLNCHGKKHININKFNALKEAIEFKTVYYKELSLPVNTNTVYNMYFNQNMRQIDIAKNFKCSRSTICGIIKSFDRKKEKKMILERKIICLECKKEFMSKRNGKFCSKMCCSLFNSKENKPQREQLQIDIQTMNWSQIGKKYNTSHTSIIRWAKKYGIYKQPSESGQRVTE